MKKYTIRIYIDGSFFPVVLKFKEKDVLEDYDSLTEWAREYSKMFQTFTGILRVVDSSGKINNINLEKVNRVVIDKKMVDLMRQNANGKGEEK